jgi:orotidine-5'-phosphate decarboxylase
MTPFGTRLSAAIAERGRFCVGIDPHAALLHEWGLADDVAGLERFALTVVEAVAPVVGVVKPQSAFYERFGSRGIAVLERVVEESRAAGALVLLDVKRGDIGSTSQAYADAYLDPASPLAKEGPEVQHARTPQGTVAGTVLDHLRRLNAGAEPMGSFGAVVGATIGETGEDLDVNGPLLVPGYGAQGGTVEDLRRIFGSAARHVLPSSSREVLRAGPDVAALREAARRGTEAVATLGS